MNSESYAGLGITLLDSYTDRSLEKWQIPVVLTVWHSCFAVVNVIYRLQDHREPTYDERQQIEKEPHLRQYQEIIGACTAFLAKARQGEASLRQSKMLNFGKLGRRDGGNGQ